MINKPMEKTKDGWQYVIPGTERIVPKRRKRKSFNVDMVDGQSQYVIPGAEQTSIREMLLRKMSQPITVRKRQKSLVGSPLFQ
jgi:hypothetical protein